MSNELPEKSNALQKLMARFRNAAKGFRGGYKNEIDSLRNEVDSYRQKEQEVREIREKAEARADELSKWEIEIREENYNVQNNKRANEERAKELSDYSKALEKRAREIEIEATRRAYKLLDGYKADLNQREAALNQGEAALNQREGALSQREGALSNREARVDGLEGLLRDDRILPENEDPKETATRLVFISRMQDIQRQLDDLNSICSELNGVSDEKVAESLKRSRNKIFGSFLAVIGMDEMTKRTK